MENKIIENHKIKTEEHDMLVDGHILKEKKVTTFIEGHHSGMEANWDATVEGNWVATEIVKYFRTIKNDQNRCLEVNKHFREGFITDNGDRRKMTEDEMDQFEKDWDKLFSLAFLNTHQGRNRRGDRCDRGRTKFSDTLTLFQPVGDRFYFTQI